MRDFTRGTWGAEFQKVDLHVHTPGSYDYQGDPSPDDLVERFLGQDLDLVALTDHDCEGWYESVVEAAEGHDLEVLPGVEITTHYGSGPRIHVTAVFPKSEADRINHTMSRLGVNPQNPQGDHADEDIEEICRIVREEGGLPILAHIDETAGAHAELERGTPVWESFFEDAEVAALEIVHEETKQEYDDFTFIRSSDAHRLEEIGRGYTYMKMTTPSFEGVRTAMLDPGSRIALETSKPTHPSIEGIYVDGGFLEDREAQFSKYLSCLIGGRGTGKSTVIELLRFGFDVEPGSDRVKQESQSLVENNLGPDDQVEIHIEAENTEKYVIKRRRSEPPVILRPNGDEVDMTISSFRDQFFDLNILSQRELLDLARSVQSQLEMIDSYLDVGDLKDEREEIKRELKENARGLQELQTKRVNLESEIEGLQGAREAVEVMEAQGVDEHVQDQEKWEEEEEILEDGIEALRAARGELDDNPISDLIPELSSSDETPNPELVDGSISSLNEARANIEELERQIDEELEDKEETLSQIRETWEDRNDAREAEHEELADEIEAETGVDITEYFAKKDDLQTLEEKEEELEDLEGEIKELTNEREDLLGQLQRKRENISEERENEIDSLNDNLQSVRVSIDARSNKDEYIGWVQETLQGSQVHTSDKEKIARTYSPRELAEKVRKRSTDDLVDDVEITETAAENFVGHEPLRDKLYELELLEVYDAPVIELHDGGWKDLTEMSDGQRCTALLSLAMVEEQSPLVIDQPEDALDNQFIVSEVVEVIREVKHSRQLIMATHNANVPVLGDAEKMLVMTSNGENGFFSDRGSIDNEDIKTKAQLILEGGEEAFKRRDEKYRRGP